MSLPRNVLAILVLLIIIWTAFLLVSYIIATTMLYTLEFPGDTLISIARVMLGLLIGGAWILGWYKLTQLWLYRILLSRRRET